MLCTSLNTNRCVHACVCVNFVSRLLKLTHPSNTFNNNIHNHNNRNYIAKMAADMRHLYSLALNECGPTMRKRRSLSMRDCVEELHERQMQMAARLTEYQRLCQEAVEAAAEKEGNTVTMQYCMDKNIPVVHMDMPEAELLQYRWDEEIFFGTTYKDKSTASTTLATAEDRSVDQKWKQADSSLVVKAANLEPHVQLQLPESVQKTQDEASETARKEEAEEDLLARKSAEQRLLAASLEMARGSSLKAIDGAAGEANVTKNSTDTATTATSSTDAASDGKDGDKSVPQGKVRHGEVEADDEDKRSTHTRKSGRVEAQGGTSTTTAATASRGSASTGPGVMEVEGTVGLGSTAEVDGASTSDRDVVTHFHQVEEAITFSRNNLGEVDIFLQDDHISGSAGGTALATSASNTPAASSSFSSHAHSAHGMASPRSPRHPGHVLDESIREIGQGDASQRVTKVVCDMGMQLVPPSGNGRGKVGQFEGLRTEEDWTRYLEQVVNNIDGKGDSGRRKRRGTTTIPISAFAYARTPRGVPLLVSPLSQFEDKFMGAVLGGPKGSSCFNGHINSDAKYTLPRACSKLPAKIGAAENVAMSHCLLQSAAASSEVKIRRLQHSLSTCQQQRDDAEIGLGNAEHVYVHTLLEDTIENKRIRRELQTLGIAPQPSLHDRNTPLSPLAETSGWNSHSSQVEGIPRGPWGRSKGKKHVANAERAAEILRQKEAQAQAVRDAALYRPTSAVLASAQVLDNDAFADGTGVEAEAEAETGAGAEAEEPPRKRSKKGRSK